MKTIDELRGRKTRETTVAPDGFKEGDVTHTASFHETTSGDPVNPDHYKGNDKGFQAIEVIEEATMDAPDGYAGMLQGNVIKYLYRTWRKAKPLEDLKKAAWYLDRLIKKLEADEAR